MYLRSLYLLSGVIGLCYSLGHDPSSESTMNVSILGKDAGLVPQSRKIFSKSVSRMYHFVSSHRVSSRDDGEEQTNNSICRGMVEMTREFFLAHTIGDNFDHVVSDCHADEVEVSSWFSFELTIKIPCTDTVSIVEPVLSQYTNALIYYMDKFSFIPFISDDFTVQSDIKFHIQSNHTIQPSGMPTKAPIQQEAVFTFRTIALLAVFFMAIVALSVCLCFLSMRKSMNKIVVGIG